MKCDRREATKTTFSSCFDKDVWVKDRAASSVFVFHPMLFPQGSRWDVSDWRWAGDSMIGVSNEKCHVTGLLNVFQLRKTKTIQHY